MPDATPGIAESLMLGPNKSMMAPAHFVPNEIGQRFIEGMTDQPLLIDPSRKRELLTNLIAAGKNPFLAAAMESEGDDFWPGEDDWRSSLRPYRVRGGILTIPVLGTLLQGFSYQVGGYVTGHQYIERAVQRGLADPDVKGIALMIDSPGGHAAGNFEVSDLIYEGRAEKPIRAFVSGAAFSGGYSIASAAQDITLARSGGTGSVGVVTMHVDMSKMLESAGVTVTLIHAGAHKVDGHPFAALPEDVEARIQGRIDKMYGVFVGTVARNRSMSEDAVRKTEALTYDAEESVEVGFADSIGKVEEAVAAFGASANMESAAMPDKTETPAAITQASLDAAVTAARSEATAAERGRFSAVLSDENYAGREKLAHKLLAETDLDAKQIGAVLETAPKVEVKTEAPATNPFVEAMNREGGPNVGTDGDAPGAEADPAKAVMADFYAAGGTAHGRRSN